jgi:hypothetical protein
VKKNPPLPEAVYGPEAHAFIMHLHSRCSSGLYLDWGGGGGGGANTDRMTEGHCEGEGGGREGDVPPPAWRTQAEITSI